MNLRAKTTITFGPKVTPLRKPDAAPPPPPDSLPAPPPKVPQRSREDQEFLPAALEILETPPSPIRMALIRLAVGFVVVALLWAWFGRLDVIAIAQGKIQPPGRVKIVQPVETGKVLRIGATNGARVAEGDVLLELDPQEARADVDSVEAMVQAYRAEITRRTAALIRATQTLPQRQASPLVWAADISEAIRFREEAVLSADLAQLDALLAATDAQIDQKHSEKRRLEGSIAAQSTLVRTLQERVDMRSSLQVSGYGSKASVIDGKEVLQKEEAILAGQKGQTGEVDAALRLLATERSKILQAFLTDNTQKRADAARQLEDYSQRLVKARNRLRNMTLRAPAEGVVQASAVFTVGQVVTVGQEVMRIVPGGATLEVEAYLPNKDIGFVELGQSVTVKVESFPFNRYGTLSGRVTSIARDAIPLPDAAQIEGNPARAAEQPTFAGAQRTQNLVFPVTIALDKPELVVDGRKVTMSPGMTVVAEIKTGSRRILEYVFSPLVETASEAMRER